MKKPPNSSFFPSSVLHRHFPSPLNRVQNSIIPLQLLISWGDDLAILCPLTYGTVSTPLRFIIRSIGVASAEIYTGPSMVLVLLMVGLEPLLCTTPLWVWPTPPSELS